MIRLWDLSALKDEFVTFTQETQSLHGHDSTVRALAFDKDGQTLASGSQDTTIKIWGKEEMNRR